MRDRTTQRSVIWLIAFLCLSALLDAIVGFAASPTFDEIHHLSYGYKIIRHDPDHTTRGFYDSQMPVSALNAIPLTIATYLERRSALPSVSAVLNRFKIARCATILGTLLLTVFIFLWTYDLYGEAAACASCVLCMVSPNLIAHGTLITTDMYHAVGVVGSLYFVRRFLLSPTLARAVVGGLALALAQMTKSFALILYPVIFLVVAGAWIHSGKRKLPSPKLVLEFAVISVLSFLLIANCAYSFDRTFLPLNKYRFQTPQMSSLQDLPIIGRVPVPTPYPFLQGLDLTKYSEETGRSYENIYLLGQLRDPTSSEFRPFKSYFLVACFYKVPIALQILFIWGLVWIGKNRKLDDFYYGEGLLLIVAAVLFAWLSFFDAAQIGIRHILPVLAIQIIIAAAAFSNFPVRPLIVKITLVALVLWMGGSVASYYPQMIPYMNEWVHDRRFAYRVLSDSNLDWGQDQDIVNRYLEKNPDVTLDPSHPVKGRVLVGANRLVGVFRGDTCCSYLMKQYEPVAQVGYAHFLFVIPSNDKAGAH